MILRPRGVWWLTPTGALCVISLPTLLLAAGTSDERYRDAWGAPKALTSQTVHLVLLGALAFAVASAVPMLWRRQSVSRAWPNLDHRQVVLLDRAARVLFWITMVGYLAFAVIGYLHGLSFSTLVGALRGQQVEGISTELGKITGITSLTQVGPAFVVVSTLVLTQRVERTVVTRLVFLLVLALVRSFLLAERVAILELLIPAATVLAMRLATTGRARTRVAVVLAPLIIIPLLLTVFGAFEYSRSWQFYSSRSTISFPHFVVERFAGYYTTAYNNGQLELTYEAAPGRIPYDTIQALWTVPGISLVGGYPDHHGVQPPVEFGEILVAHGNVEFNSPGGLVIPFVDWGTQGGLVYLAIAGGIVGLLYRRCVDGHAIAVLLFPSMTTGLFELPRYIYWTQGRYTPSLVALCVVGYLMHRVAASTSSSTDLLSETADTAGTLVSASAVRDLEPVRRRG